MEPKMELIVRALIIRDRKILVCQTAGRDYFFLPGGHVEFSETLRDALRRELYEEIGAILKEAAFIGGVENLFLQDGVQKHEISFIFNTEVDVKQIISREDHVSFYWFSMDQFIEANIAPPAMKDAILEWTAEKDAFFIESNNSQ